MNELQPAVTRTWTRDGTTNLMGLDDAIENLARNQPKAEGDSVERRLAVRRYLLAGRTLRTANATFALNGHELRNGRGWSYMDAVRARM